MQVAVIGGGQMSQHIAFRGILPGYRPMARFRPEIDTSDIAVARDSLINTYNPHFFSAPKHLDFRFRHQKLSLKTVSINDLYYGSGGSVWVDDLRDFFSIMLPLHGVQELKTGAKRHSLVPGQVFVVGPSYHLKQVFSPEYRMLSIRIGVDRFNKFLQEEFETYAGTPLEFEMSSVGPSPASAGLFTYIKYLSEATIDLKEDPYDELLAEYTERSLLAKLLTTLPNNYQRAISPREAGSCQALIDAEAFIRKNAAATIGVDDIAAAAGVSVRTLYYAFRKFRGWTPMEFLKRHRLQIARRLLISSDHTATTVTRIACSCGFNHMGKFSRDYARQFGERPSETLRTSPTAIITTMGGSKPE